MAKKLTVEVDAETSKAKRKIQQLAETGGSSGVADSVSGAAQRAARSLDNASNAANKLTKSTVEGSSRLLAMTKMFGGMAIRMGASYAASNMEAGSKGQMLVKGGGEVAGGAMAGAAFGPLGAIAGGLMGLTSALMEAAQAEKDRRRAINDATYDFKKSEIDYRSNKDFENTLRSLNEIDKGFADFAGRIKEVDELLEKYRASEERQVRKVQEFIDKGDFENANYQRGYLNENRSRQERLEALRDRFEKMAEASKPEARTPIAALDSLARIGGDFAGSDAGMRNLTRINEKQVAILEKIEAKTGKGSGRF